MSYLAPALADSKHTWLVTGAAGFIGSNLCEALIQADQNVVGFDNFATGKPNNIHYLKALAKTRADSAKFRFMEADIGDEPSCQQALQGVDYVLHQAALGSVPRSISNPLASHRANVDGFLNILHWSKEAKIKRLVYASSSSVYGDHPDLPKQEQKVGNPLSPYAATKAINEVYAGVFQRTYGIQAVGLRYFNVFGPRQDPNGPYAAVIPRWVAAIINQTPVVVNGDGKTSRDFCYIANVVQANLRAALNPNAPAIGTVFNVACGERTNLLQLAKQIEISLQTLRPDQMQKLNANLEFRDFRAGDVLHSLADTCQAVRQLGYAPSHSLEQGLLETCAWYLKHPEKLI